ncbi:MAG TPA: hypothetical protein DCE23_09960 [Firmicutes bacterium]|nr:hypothetical protein [Bacillota bacterium]
MQLRNINSYINSKTYNINLTPNKIYINNYNDILEIKENIISIDFNDFFLNINGNDFKVVKMLNNEVLFNGKIESMEYIYKK